MPRTPNAKPTETFDDDAATMAAKANANRVAAAAAELMGRANPAPDAFEIMPPATAAAIEARKPKMTVIKLLRNYRPAGVFEIVGHDKPALLRKNAAGVMVEVEKGGFVKGEPAPAATPGTGFANKLWAGTVIKVATEEAKNAKRAGIAEYELED